MFWEVSNYNLRAMEKTNFCILLFFVFLTSMCNSNDYTYDSYEYDEYYYQEKYDYNNQNTEDYTDYYDQNLLAPPNPPPLPPIPPPETPPPMGKITFFYFKYYEI